MNEIICGICKKEIKSIDYVFLILGNRLVEDKENSAEYYNEVQYHNECYNHLFLNLKKQKIDIPEKYIGEIDWRDNNDK